MKTNDIVSAWESTVVDNYTSMQEGVRQLNRNSLRKLTPHHIREMRQGTRTVPPDVSRLMMNDIMPDALAGIGFPVNNITAEELHEFVRLLSPPPRVK